MASRQEEKEARRAERLAREQAEAAAAARRKRVQMVFGGLLAAAAVAGLILLGISALGGNDEKDADTAKDGGASAPSASVQLPEQKEDDWQQAAKTAGCELINPPYEGAGHEERKFTPADYKTNPPTSGSHFPTWYDDGVYAPGEATDLGQLVHTLEHGRINLQYEPGTPASVVKKLEALMAEQNEGYHMLLYENTTNMKYEVAATAWTHLLGCEKFTDDAIDAIRTFRARYIDKGPETVP